MKPGERIRDIQSALQRRFRAAGHGSIRRVQEALSLGSGYFKDQRRPGRRRVDLRVLFRALDELAVAPADFFADALGAVDMEIVFRSEAAALRRRMKKPPRLLELEAEHRSPEPEDPAASRDAELAELDAEAAEIPKRAVRRSYGLMRRLPRRDLPRLLGIAASAYRRLGHPHTAQVVLARALEMIASRPDMAVRADLLHRASRLAADEASGEQALGLSELATLDFVRSGDLAAAGETMVDQGRLWMDLGRWRRGSRRLSSALAYLPAGDGPEVRRQRLLCLTSLGECHRRLGELDQARRCARQAAEIRDGASPRRLASAA